MQKQGFVPALQMGNQWTVKIERRLICGNLLQQFAMEHDHVE